VAGLIVAPVGNWTIKAMHRETQETLWGMHVETQGTLKSIHAETEPTLRQLGAGMTTMDTGLKQILDRMETNAKARYRDLQGRLDGEEEVPPA
jgi:hypothetical protein